MKETIDYLPGKPLKQSCFDRFRVHSDKRFFLNTSQHLQYSGDTSSFRETKIYQNNTHTLTVTTAPTATTAEFRSTGHTNTSPL
jgi:hypothetical protein